LAGKDILESIDLMALPRWAYRAYQFGFALVARPEPDALERARDILTGKQFALFEALQPHEQAHALTVLARLEAQGETHPDLFVAALLHDVGKTCYPLRVWEHVLAVLGRRFLPRRARAWGQDGGDGWHKAFAVAEQHPIWGAQMAAACGVTPLAVSIIRRHQGERPATTDSTEDRLLAALQAVDDES
jgi:hypothetical protein